MNRLFIASLAGTLGLAGLASADEIFVTDDIATSVVWTADNTYNLQTQIYVLPGASLTIEKGTTIATTPSANGSGSLAVCRGAKIFALGTADEPITMTSTADNGTWREAANEWGNLTIMGNAYISNSFEAGNSSTFGNNQSPMEGLVEEFPGDPKVIYGGNDDEDNSGALAYLSIRYGGRVVGLANELNGLSLGGLGRGTDIDHIEIMNNVDDGIEIWGGTVNLNYVNIWNIGDDSFDIDQGWRGSAQYGLIVQGYSLDASQGSGVGDNMCETDGAENSDAQPVTTAQIANFTMIGQPDGDGATVWRDGARVQYRQCIIMDCGEKVVRPDGDDGDGSAGYGFNGTLTLAQVFNTPATVKGLPNVSGVNGSGIAGAGGAAYLYQAQVDGTLAGINDTVLFNNVNYSDYNTLNGSRDNVISASSPIVSITRGAPVLKGGKVMIPVTAIDPRAAGDATTSNGGNGENGFVEAAGFRGGFAADSVWLCGWSAADQFGFLATPTEFCAVAEPCPADLNGDGVVSGADVGLLLSAWGTDGADLNGDGVTNGADFGLLLSAFGPCA
jgi:hypothetical protein